MKEKKNKNKKNKMDQEALLAGKATHQQPKKRSFWSFRVFLVQLSYFIYKERFNLDEIYMFLLSGLIWIASQALEKLAYYGLAPNMILYLTGEYGMATTEAAKIILLWSAATNFFPLVGAFVADSYTGRFPLIGFGSSTSLLVHISETMKTTSK